MGKIIISLTISLLLLLMAVPLAQAGNGKSIEDLEKRIEALEKQLGRFKAEKEEEKKREGSGFRPIKAEWLEIGGELELELVDTERESDSGTFGSKTNESETHFQLDKFILVPKVTLNDDIYMRGELRFGDSSAYLDEWQVYFKNLRFNSYVKVGKDQRFISEKILDKFSRKTEGYPLLGKAFWEDQEYAITWIGEQGGFAWALSYGDGLDLTRSNITEDTTTAYRMLQDDDNGDDEKHEIGVGLRYRFELAEKNTLDVTGFSYWDKLSSGEITGNGSSIQTAIGSSDSQRRVGGRLTWKPGAAMLIGEYITAEDGALERDGWYLQGSYKHKFGYPLIADRYLTAVEPVIRYGELDVDTTKVVGDARTWDRERWTLALLLDIYKNIKIKAEYYINDESTGGKELDNDELMVQLEVKF